MSEAEFRATRRQKFMTEKYFKLNQTELSQAMEDMASALERKRLEGKIDSHTQDGIFKNRMAILRLHYTAGDPIETLKPLYDDAMQWFHAWHQAEYEYSVWLANRSGKDLHLDMTPLHFDYLADFQLALDVISIGLLLGEISQVREAAKLMQSARHTDMLFEFLIERVVSDPSDIEEFFHEEPYGPLVDAIFTADTPEQASAFVKQYLDNWYKAFEGIPWHNGHLKAFEEYMPYEGYWAFEAAAVCVLQGIDDSSFRDHLVYPKDFADWAREHVADVLASGSGSAMKSRPNVPANQPCPEAGWWFTPAQANSRRYFKQGEVMPSLGGDYGLTFWQWSPDQSAPKL